MYDNEYQNRSTDYNHPNYGQKTATIALVIVLMVIGGLGFTAWSAFNDVNEDEEVVVKTKDGLIVQRGVDPEADEENGEVYDYFYNTFRDPDYFGPDYYNFDPWPEGAGDQAFIEQDLKYYAMEMAEGREKYSLDRIMSGEVTDAEGRRAGKVHDILIHKETGKATAIIVRKDGSYYDRDLSVLTFGHVKKQAEDGDVEMTVTKDSIEEQNAFTYNDLNQDAYISLKDLKDGQILDYEGNVVGSINTILYQNAEATKIYFTLAANMQQPARPKTFALSYDNIEIVRNPDGFDIQLSKDQTEALAEDIYGEGQ